MSTNGKEYVDTFNIIFNKYFLSKVDIPNIVQALDYEHSSNIVLYKLYDIKFIYTIHNRNQNRLFFPFLGCYCQRGASFIEDYSCRLMIDKEH